MYNKYKKKIVIIVGCICAVLMCLNCNGYTATADYKNTAIAATVTTAPAPMGDLNFDGKIDLTDANLALKAALGTIDVSDAVVRAGDINGNGTIDLSDAKVILNWAIGK